MEEKQLLEEEGGKKVGRCFHFFIFSFFVGLYECLCYLLFHSFVVENLVFFGVLNWVMRNSVQAGNMWTTCTVYLSLLLLGF